MGKKKKKKREYENNWCHSMSKEDNQKLKRHEKIQKNIDRRRCAKKFLWMTMITWGGYVMHCLNILFLLLLAKHNVLRLLSPLLFLFHSNFSVILGNSEVKKKSYRTSNTSTIQLFVAIKVNFSSLFFLWTSRS